jgi:phage-related protein
VSTPGGDVIGQAQIQVDADTDPAIRALRDFSRATQRPSKDTDRFSTALRGLGSVAGGLGGVFAKFGIAAGAVGAAAGTAVPLLAGIVTALENIAPAGTVAATGLLAIEQASIAVKLGMVGIQDAVQSALDPAKAKNFDKAIKNLAPNAREFAREVKALQPELQKFQQGVQNRIFKDFGVALDVLSKTVLPTVRTNLNQTADTLNRMALGVAGAAVQLSENGTLGQAVAGANTGLTNLVKIPAQVTTALGQLAVAGAPAFDQLTGAAADVATRVSTKLGDAFKSGALQDSVNTAVGLLQNLGEIAGNVFGTVKNVLGSVSGEGGGAFTVLTQVTQALQDATATQGFQEAMQALAETMGVVGEVLGGTVGTLLADLGPVFTQLAGPVQSLVQTFGTALAPVLGALADTFTVLGTTLGPLLESAFTSLSPVLVALAGPLQVLISSLGAALGPIIDALGPVLLSAATAIGNLVVALSPLLPVVGNLIAALLPPLIPIIDTLGQTFTDLAPLVLQVGEILTAVLAPIIGALPEIITPLLDTFTQLTATLLPVLSDLLVQLAPTFTQLAGTVAELIVAAAPLLQVLGPLLVDVIAALLPVITPVIGLLTSLVSVLVDNLAGAITNVIVPAIDVIVALFSGDLSGAVTALGDLFAGVWEQIKTVVSNVGGFISDAINTIIGIFQYLYDTLIGNSIIPDLIGAIVAAFAGLPGRAAAALGGLVGSLVGVARSAGARMLGAVRGGVSDAVDVFRGLKDRARSALGNLGSTLYGAGQSLIRGFIDGIKSMIGSVKSAASSVVSSARDFFPFSPAKEGPFSGRGWTLYSGEALATDFAKGITRNQAAVRDAVNSLVGTAVLPQTRTGDLSQFLTTARTGSTTQTALNNITVAPSAAPKVTVMIGNRVINEHVRVIVDQASDQAAREQIQGVRR